MSFLCVLCGLEYKGAAEAVSDTNQAMERFVTENESQELCAVFDAPTVHRCGGDMSVLHQKVRCLRAGKIHLSCIQKHRPSPCRISQRKISKLLNHQIATPLPFHDRG